MENLASLQKLNLDMSNLEEEEERVKSLKEKLHKSLQTIDSDLEREKSISLDASLNEKRILEEKNELIKTENTLVESENVSNELLNSSKSKLNEHKDDLDSIIKKIERYVDERKLLDKNLLFELKKVVGKK